MKSFLSGNTGRKVKEFWRNPHWNSPNNKVYCRVVKKINQFWDVTVSLIDGQIETDVYVKSTDSHQYLHSPSCHSYHCKKNISYSQALHLNRICYKNTFFDIHCNNLEKLPSERGYSEKLVRKKILKAKSQSRETLLNKEKLSKNDELLLTLRTILPLKTLDSF